MARPDRPRVVEHQIVILQGERRFAVPCDAARYPGNRLGCGDRENIDILFIIGVIQLKRHSKIICFG